MRFESATTLLAYLTSRHGDLDEKDQIYAVLVRAVQARGARAQLAFALAWCGLWPGLDRLYRRRLRYFVADPDELTQEISVVFSVQLGTMNLGRVTRVAATLVRNTDRDVMATRRRRLREKALGPNDVDLYPAEHGPNRGRVSPPSVDPRAFVDEIARLRSEIGSLVGPDADLVLAVLVLGFDQRQAAVRLGLTHEATRKRFQRAVFRIRAHLQETVSSRAAAKPAQRAVDKPGRDSRQRDDS